MHKLLLFLAALAVTSARAENFDLHDGDRVALIGDTLIERAQESGWLETILDASFADRHVLVRNLGWSADTPAGASRLAFDFDQPDKGLTLLTDEVAQVRPSVVILGYGMASSFAGREGLPQFRADMNRLIDAIEAGSARPVRFIILSPLRHEKLPPPLPDPTVHNAVLAQYTQVLRQIAQERGYPFVDLFDWRPASRARDVTDNGIHLTPRGYRLMAAEMARQLGWRPRLDSVNKKTLERLRQEILRKDQLFFDRWRPENPTYLFWFRKNEQGQNAREIPEFDPLIDAADQRIFQWQECLGGSAKPPAPLPAVALPKASVAPPLPEFDIAPGFEINLWAATPLLKKPTQMNFDPRGRLWVATSSIYPQIEPGQKANDQIVILEDTHGTGRADRSTVFADGLFVPTGVEPGDGGCYVTQSTELLHFSGGAKAETRRVVLSGFGTEDSHQMVHTLNWGPDGMLYFNQSIYIHTHLETPNGVVHLNSGGVFHLRPPSMQLDVFLRGFCNPWGHQFDAFGQSFVTDGAGYDGLSWGIAGATYFTYASMRRELASISPGSYPKFCGLAIVASRQFPDDWQGNMLTADFRAHRLVRFSVSPDGAGYVSEQMPDFLRTTNESFRPIDMKFGPDGALYVADWCNPIINHGEVDFRDPRRDHEHGRIWRITAKGRPLERRRDLTRAGNRALLDNLLSPNSYDMEQSRRVLTERGPRILSALGKWTARHTNETALLQSLWMHQCIGVRDDSLLDRLLNARDGRIRAASARVLAAWPRSHTDAAGLEPDDCYERLLRDPFPRVRVESLRAIAGVPSLRSAAWALNTLNDEGTDPFLDYALWLTINDLAKPWLEAVQSGAWKIAGQENQLAFALKAIPRTLAGPVLAELLKKQPLTPDGQGPWIELIGKVGMAVEVQKLYDDILNHTFTPVASGRAWPALSEAATRSVQPTARTEKLAAYFEGGDEETRMDAVRLAGRWKVEACLAKLCALPASPGVTTAVRTAALDAMREIGGAEVIAALQPWTRRGEPMELRQPAMLALAAMDLPHAGPPAISLLLDLTNQETEVSVWRSLLGNAGAGAVLAAALPKNGFPRDLAKEGLRAARESGDEQPELVLALTRASGWQGADAELTKDEILKLAESIRKSGDPARGERIFRSQQQSCATCHSIGGVGGHVGPDLTSIGASAQMDYLIDSVYYPNKQIKDGFASCIVETRDGEELAGIPVRENDHELVLRTAADQDVTVAKSQIVHRKVGGSLMPSGLTDNLSLQQQWDLFRFLSELGKPGPFDASSGNVARFWKVAPAEGDPASLAPGLTGERWHPVSSLVDGRLLREDIQSRVPGGAGLILAGVRFRTAKAGPIHFNVTPEDATAWIDGKATPLHAGIVLELPAGTHEAIFRLDSENLPAFIRLQSADATFLTN